MSSKKNIAIIPKPDLSATNSGRIAQVLLNVDLRNSHEGLMAIASKRGVNFDTLPVGHYLVFVNEQKNRFKIFAPTPDKRGAIVAYYKSFEGRVDRTAIESVPMAFGIKRKFETSTRIAERLDDELRYQRIRTVKPLP